MKKQWRIKECFGKSWGGERVIDGRVDAGWYGGVLRSVTTVVSRNLVSDDSI